MIAIPKKVITLSKKDKTLSIKDRAQSAERRAQSDFFAALCILLPAFSILRSAFSILRSALSILRSALSILRSALCALRSALSILLLIETRGFGSIRLQMGSSEIQAKGVVLMSKQMMIAFLLISSAFVGVLLCGCTTAHSRRQNQRIEELERRVAKIEFDSGEMTSSETDLSRYQVLARTAR